MSTTPKENSRQIFLAKREWMEAIWPDIQKGVHEISESVEGEIDPEFISDCLLNGSIQLHCMVDGDDLVAFMITQGLKTGTGKWIDIMMGYSVDKKIGTFFEFVEAIESFAKNAGCKGVKFITMQPQLRKVMCNRMGYRSRFVEVLKEV